MTLYRDIVAKAFVMSWRHKILWFFALFAVLPGTGGFLDFFFRGADSLNGQAVLLGMLHAQYRQGTLGSNLTNIHDKFTASPALFVFGIVAIIIAALALISVIIVSQATIIDTVLRIQSKSSTTLADAIRRGMGVFQKILSINLAVVLVKLAPFLFIALPGAVLFVQHGTRSMFDLYIAAMFVILIPLSMFLLFLVIYASCYVIAQQRSWQNAFAGAWKLFMKNWLVTIEVALLLYAITVFISSFVLLTLVLVGLPASPAGLVALLLVQTLFGVYLGAFQYSAWVLLFSELETGRIRSKLLRVTSTWNAAKTSVVVPNR